MTNHRPLPLPATVKMPDLWVMRLERVACAYVKGIVLGREAFEGMVQQMRLARFSKRSAREAEYREYLRKEEERVEEMAAAEAARVATVLDRRAEAVEARVAVELQRVETGEVLDNLTRFVAYQEAREALEFLLESRGRPAGDGRLRAACPGPHRGAGEGRGARVQARAGACEAYRAEDGKFRAEQVEARDEASSLHARELNKSMVEWRKDLEKITDDARFEATETRKRFTKKQQDELDKLRKELEQRLDELKESLQNILDAVAAKEEKMLVQIQEELDPDWKNPDIQDRKAEKKLREKLCNQPIPLLKDLKVEVAGVINVADTKKQQKSWLDTLHAQRTDKMKEDGSESKILLLNARKKFEAKFEREIDLETKAVIKKQDEVLAIKKQEDAAATEEYTKKLDEEAKNMEELFKKQGADFTELMSGKKTKIREFWEKNKSKQRKANQSRTTRPRPRSSP